LINFSIFRAPANIPIQYSKHNDMFNLTMTYCLNSDISWVYGKVFDISSGALVAPAVDAAWKLPDENFQGKLIFSLNGF
jgi:hypothetical protein